MENKIFHNKFYVLIIAILLLQNYDSIAQNYVEGQVFRASDSTAINGASIYFDGTSIGTVSDTNGAFKIPYKENNALLVISYLSTEPAFVDLNKPQSKGKRLAIYLNEKLEELDVVELGLDTWSREKKMRIFKRQFIGAYPTWSYCKIENEDAIKLRYIPSSQILVASSKVPIVIKNKKLGYKISYNLTDFEVTYKKSTNGFNLVHKVYYEGSSFFEPLKKRTSKKVVENRKLSYLGSSLHFFRALYAKELSENNFDIFYNRFRVAPLKHFDINYAGTRKSVTLNVEKIAILYNNYKQSNLTATSIFYIDNYGNHSPPNAINIGGDMAKRRIAELLPLDYQIEE